jgi:hypothetical protein
MLHERKLDLIKTYIMINSLDIFQTKIIWVVKDSSWPVEYARAALRAKTGEVLGAGGAQTSQIFITEITEEKMLEYGELHAKLTKKFGEVSAPPSVTRLR